MGLGVGEAVGRGVGDNVSAVRATVGESVGIVGDAVGAEVGVYEISMRSPAPYRLPFF